MGKTRLKRLESMVPEELVRLATRQRGTIARLERTAIHRERALDERLSNLRDLTKERDAMVHDLNLARFDLSAAQRDSVLFERQGRHVKALYEAMLQRYVGVKLDTQQFTFPQARQFIDNELAALEGSLGAIREQVDSERANGCSQLERAAA